MKILEFCKHFNNETDCEHYLKIVREKQGLVCPECKKNNFTWDRFNKCWICKDCGKKIRLTSGTVMHGSKLPLMYWFTTIHLLTSTKKTFSASEIQRQLGHKRYQPIWEMLHKLRSVMGLRDDSYKLKGTIELDEAFFSTDNSKKNGKKSTYKQKRGAGSQTKSKVLVMIESEEVDENDKKANKKDRKCGYLKVKVMEKVTNENVLSEATDGLQSDTKIITDNASAHNKLQTEFNEVDAQTTPAKEAHERLPWVHTAISNAKSLILDMYHGIIGENLQLYLNEFCWKFNRRYMIDGLFERLVITSIASRGLFMHKIYKA